MGLGMATLLAVSAALAAVVQSAGGAPVLPPSISKSFQSASIPLNGTTTVRFTIVNPNPPGTNLSGVGFSDTLPAGLVVATPNGLNGLCFLGTVTATAGSATVSMAGALVGSGQCGFTVNVVGIAVGTQHNTTSAVISDQGNGNSASATVNVLAVAPPLTGTVLTAGGAPEPGACIVVFAASTPTGPFGGAISDAQGTYVLGGLPGATDLTVGFIPPFTGPGGPCDLSNVPLPPPPGALQPVWAGNVFFNLADPTLGPNPYAASLAQGAQIVHAGDTVDACLTSAPATQIPRPPCVPAAAAVIVTPTFTG
jgi:uncharacterized repeat protein (TIGR01451 family)